MGRASNRKWTKRRAAYRLAKVADKLRLDKLFGWHRRFRHVDRS